MQVSTSNNGRSAGSAKRTPLVATTGTWNVPARSISIAVVGFFVAQQMALQLDIHVAAPEHTDERIDQSADAVSLKPQQLAPGQRDEPAGLPVEIVERQRALAFRRAHLHARDETAQIAVALGGFDENGHTEG